MQQEPSAQTLALLGQVSLAMSGLSSDRALQLLVESIVTTTDCQGAVLMIPHEKLSEMIPLFAVLPDDMESFQERPAFQDAAFKMFQDEDAVLLNAETSEFPELSTLLPKTDIWAVPVILGGKAVAMMFLVGVSGSATYLERHQGILDFLSPFLGSILENFRLQNEMIHKNSRLSALYEISQRAESLIDFRDVYDALYQVVKSFTHFDAYRLYLLSNDQETLLAHDTSLDAGLPSKVQLGQGPIGIAALNRKPHLTYTETFNSVLVLPIIVSGNLVGVLAIGSRKSYAYKDEDIIGLRIISTQIASIDQIFKDLLRLRGVTQHILESMTSGVMIFDNNDQLTYCNPEITRILHCPIPEGWTPGKPGNIVPAPLVERLARILEDRLEVENDKMHLDQLDRPRILEINAFPFRDEAGVTKGTAVFFRDVTQISHLEDQLRRADRLSALGVLAAGIAHEIRNPLTGMKMIVQLLHSEFVEGDARREPLSLIQKEVDRLEKIIVNLLDFARPTKPRVEPLALFEVLQACLLLVQNQVSKQRITLETTYPEQLPGLIGDPHQLKQVFLNILTNAMQAMPFGGRLEVRVEAREDHVRVAFRDSGMGIPQKRIKAIFDPFMTTKEEGTGLGLSMALRILEEHGGRIEVHSIEHQGSTFTVCLPIRQQMPDEEISL